DDICEATERTLATAIAFSRGAFITVPGKLEGHLGLGAAVEFCRRAIANNPELTAGEVPKIDLLITPDFFNPRPEETKAAASKRLHHDFDAAMDHIKRLYAERSAAFEAGYENLMDVGNPYFTVMLCEGATTLDGETITEENGNGHQTVKSAGDYFARLIQERT